MSSETKRNLGIDILCCVGVMLLLGVQYMDAAGFMQQPVTSWAALLPTAVRWFGLSGAAMLAAGTGYVLSTKPFSGSYFKILIRLVYVYLVCSLLALAVRVVILGDVLTLRDAVYAVLHFQVTQTGRFAGMYFALLIGAPYLNAMFRGLETRGARLSLLLLLGLAAGLQPMLLVQDVYLLPAWCKGLFPAAAYIGGAYVRKYVNRRRLYLILPLIGALLLAESVTVVALARLDGVMGCPWLDSMAALPSLGIGLLMLTLLRSRKAGESAAHRFFAGAAGGAISALLLGELAIQAAMPAVTERFPSVQGKLAAGWIVVPVLFILCCVGGLILQTPLLGLRSYLQMEDEDEAFAEEPARKKRPEVVLPGRTHTEASPTKRNDNPRHTIRVPVTVPETTVRLTQPGAEPVQGTLETDLSAPSLEFPTMQLPSAAEETEMKVYVPKHAASSDAPRNGTRKPSAAVFSATQAAARREKMTVEDVLLAEKRERRQRDGMGTVTKGNRFSD